MLSPILSPRSPLFIFFLFVLSIIGLDPPILSKGCDWINDGSGFLLPLDSRYDFFYADFIFNGAKDPDLPVLGNPKLFESGA